MTMLYICTCLFCLLRCHGHHFMRYRTRENNHHIGTAYLIFKIRRTLRKNLALTAVFFTYFLILAVHSVMSAHYNNTHFSPSFRCNKPEPAAVHYICTAYGISRLPSAHFVLLKYNPPCRPHFRPKANTSNI